MPERPLNLLDQLCFHGFTEGDFAQVRHWGAAETIQSFRAAAIAEPAFNPGGANAKVAARLELVLAAFLSGGFARPARAGVFRALCMAAVREVPQTVDSLFTVQPRQWGMRGDPYLWGAMATHLALTPLPETEDALEQLLRETFEHLAGAPISSPEPFYVAEYAHGGMSSGCIYPRFWRDCGFPLLLKCYREATAG